MNPVTPQEAQPELAQAIGLPLLYLKREDLHPYGSHKGRSIPVMIDHYYAASDRHFAISSSGNAALAAALHMIEAAPRATLDIFVGNKIAPHKLEKLKALASDYIRVLTKENPLQALFQATQDGTRSLRQSQDDIALVGYESLAEELATIKNLGAVFMGTSSGTTAQALADYFLNKKLPIQVHIVQTSSCHPMADAFETYDGPNEESSATAISDRVAARKSALIPLIRKTGGRGWTATNDDISSAQQLVQKYTGLDISTNSALSIVGAMKTVQIGHEIKGATICILGGE